MPQTSGSLQRATITVLRPSQGVPGAGVEVSVQGFSAGAAVRLWWIHTDGTAELVGEGASTSSGTCTLQFTVPQVPPGYYIFHVSDNLQTAIGAFVCAPAGASASDWRLRLFARGT